ncbi:asparaginase domain-containing protein [Acidihalobacter ferrooxydans]|uniref:Asparaginase n=1 Tax=Acidihalobacter ferrooxydans TaxID=1765967 RepID=A0A1P8UHT5_9GAMM|nr:asparaginase domain-containing protein [Acidihalobacter ferrooxydans]APZ43406.1 asparaginase [Acidihalobacter ferrooxydans]
MHIHILTTGGTLDKVYHDALSDYRIGEPAVRHILDEAGVTFAYTVEEVLRKDSLEIDAADRALIRERAAACPHRHILITHGTDTMTQTAEQLRDLPDKVIVLTGAMQPARFRISDAAFNVGLALGALQTLGEGVYIAMSGRVFPAGSVRKNRAAGRFEQQPDAR